MVDSPRLLARKKKMCIKQAYRGCPLPHTHTDTRARCLCLQELHRANAVRTAARASALRTLGSARPAFGTGTTLCTSVAELTLRLTVGIRR